MSGETTNVSSRWHSLARRAGSGAGRMKPSATCSTRFCRTSTTRVHPIQKPKYEISCVLRTNSMTIDNIRRFQGHLRPSHEPPHMGIYSSTSRSGKGRELSQHSLNISDLPERELAASRERGRPGLREVVITRYGMRWNAGTSLPQCTSASN